MTEEIKNEVPQEQAQEAVAEPKAPTIDYEAEFKKLKAENEKLKQATTNASADASNWKKKYRETLSEQERQQAEQAERISAMEAENAQYKAEKRVASYQSKLLGIGYDPQTAQAMANALPDGMDDSFFEAQKAFLETKAQAIRAEALNSQPNLTAGKAPSSQNIEDPIVTAFKKGAMGW